MTLIAGIRDLADELAADTGDDLERRRLALEQASIALHILAAEGWRPVSAA